MIRTQVVVQSARATVRVTPLHPLFAATSILIFVAVVTSRLGVQASEVLGLVGAGALAGGVALGLDDEAASMLRSSPTHALDRLAHRLTVLVPASMAAAAALVVTDRLFVPGPSAIPAVTATTALVAVGLAVQMWWSRRWADTAAEGAAAVVTAWALASLLAPDLLFLHRFAGAWRTHAHWVLGLSVVLVITGATGRRP
jgi:hypothetical protein